MGRPREFEETEVLDAALRIFWERGFAGASIEDLAAASGLSRASLYGAFHDKLGLYRRALGHYLKRLEGLDADALGAGPVRPAIQALLIRFIAVACPDSGPKGCFLQLSAGSGPADDDLAQTIVAGQRQFLEKRLTEAIVRGQRSGELSSVIAPPRLAAMLMVLLQGVSQAARTGSSRADLEAVAATAVALLG